MESEEIEIGRKTLTDYLTMLNGVYSLSLSGNMQLAAAVKQGLWDIRGDIEGRNFAEKYFGYKISEDEINGLLERGLSEDELSQKITGVATILKL